MTKEGWIIAVQCTAMPASTVPSTQPTKTVGLQLEVFTSLLRIITHDQLHIQACELVARKAGSSLVLGENSVSNLFGALSPVNHRGLHQGCPGWESEGPNWQIAATGKPVSPEQLLTSVPWCQWRTFCCQPTTAGATSAPYMERGGWNTQQAYFHMNRTIERNKCLLQQTGLKWKGIC